MSNMLRNYSFFFQRNVFSSIEYAVIIIIWHGKDNMNEKYCSKVFFSEELYDNYE